MIRTLGARYRSARNDRVRRYLPVHIRADLESPAIESGLIDDALLPSNQFVRLRPHRHSHSSGNAKSQGRVKVAVGLPRTRP